LCKKTPKAPKPPISYKTFFLEWYLKLSSYTLKLSYYIPSLIYHTRYVVFKLPSYILALNYHLILNPKTHHTGVYFGSFDIDTRLMGLEFMIGITFLWLVYPLLDLGSLPCHVYVLSHMYCLGVFFFFLHSLHDLFPCWSFCSFATLAWLASSLGANLLVSHYYYARVV
jgi:hypothetical protein